MDEWAIVIARAIPFFLWSGVLRVAPAAIRSMEPNSDMRSRWHLLAWLVEGACIAIFAGGLASAGFITGDIAKLVYTVFGAIVAIVAIVLLWTFWSRRDDRDLLP